MHCELRLDSSSCLVLLVNASKESVNGRVNFIVKCIKWCMEYLSIDFLHEVFLQV